MCSKNKENDKERIKQENNLLQFDPERVSGIP